VRVLNLIHFGSHCHLMDRNRVIKCLSLKQVIRRFSNGASGNTLVKIDYVDKIGIISLNDPGRLNALTVTMGTQFQAAVNEIIEASHSQKIRGCIVTGSGDAFSAGGDLKWLRERHHESSSYRNAKTMVDFYNRYLCVRNIPVPTVAAINGAAIGAGLCMSLACDIRVVASNAKVGFTFAKLGIHPGMGCSVLLPRVTSQEIATYLLSTGKIIDGKTAVEKGLALEAVLKADVMKRAMEIATEMGSGSPIAVQSCLQTLRNQKFANLDQGLAREADCQAVAYSSKDFARGLDAVEAKKSDVKFEGW